MAEVCKKICDLCGKELEENRLAHNINGYNKIEVKLSQYNTRDFLLCDECMEKYGLLNKEKEVAKIKEDDTVENFFNMLADIVAERINQ